VFRDVGTTTETGVITRSGDRFVEGERVDGVPETVYARVRIDPNDGSGTASPRTNPLEEAVDVMLLPRTASATTLSEDTRLIDTAELTVGDPAVTLSGPDSYVPGQTTTLRGRADGGVDAIALYVRTSAASEFELVDLDGSVDGELSGLSVSGSFQSEVELSSGDATGNALLLFPGTYRLAAVQKADVVEDGGRLPQTLSPPAVLAEAAALRSIEVRRHAISLDQPGLDGRLAATAGTARVSGTVSDDETALLVAIGDRGTLSTETVSGPAFSDVDLSVDGFPEGQVTVFAVSAGRDGRVGDGSIRDARIATELDGLPALDSHLLSLSATSRDADQLRSVLRNETDRDTASDDPVARKTFRIVPESIEITSPEQNATVQAGNTVTVTGTTTVPARTAPVDVSMERDGAGAERRVEQGSNGTWEASLPTGDLSPGRHRITARVGGATDVREVVVADAAASRAVDKPGPETSRENPPPRTSEPTSAASAAGAPGTATASGSSTDGWLPRPDRPGVGDGWVPWLGLPGLIGVTVILVALLLVRYRR
jgi:major cell surface glycoprotein (TIGR04216 family)